MPQGGLTLADGQLASSAATVLDVAADGMDRVVNASFRNTSTTLTETVALTLTPTGGSTARSVVRAVLSPNETLVVTGLGVGAGAVLKGSATDASTVDYVVQRAMPGPYDVRTYDASGLLKMTGNTSTTANLTATGTLTVAGDIVRTAGYADYTHRSRVRVFEDFLAAAGVTLPAPWGKHDTSSAGSPTTNYVANAFNGEYNIAHDSQSEQQNLALYWADQLMIDPTKNPVFECRMKINFAGAAFTADQRIVIGLAAARNATLDSNATHAWFRIEGANLNILWETDDASTDDDDNDSTIDIVDDTYTVFRIELSDLADIKFYVDGVRCGGGTAAAALTASHKLQPYVEIQRDAGAETESVVIDYIMVEQDRT